MIPPHLHGASMDEAPKEFLEFAKKYGVTAVFFVDDQMKCNRSIRADSLIWVNTRCTFWDIMILPPLCCRDACDVITLRFLHEVGHVSLNHTGDPSLKSTTSGLQIERNKIFWENNFTGSEGEAWEFAFQIRKNEPNIFKSLYESCKKWYSQHCYDNKDWDNDSENMWARKNKQRLEEVRSSIPPWVYDRFGKYLPNGV